MGTPRAQSRSAGRTLPAGFRPVDRRGVWLAGVSADDAPQWDPVGIGRVFFMIGHFVAVWCVQ